MLRSSREEEQEETEKTADRNRGGDARGASSTATVAATAATATATSASADDGEYSFFDQATVYVRAGSGGQGASTYKLLRKTKNQRGPPDGGNGGNGGDVVMVVDPSLNTLAGLSGSALRPNAYGGSGAAVAAGRRASSSSSSSSSTFIKSFRAENGQPGSRQCKSGRYGKDCTIRVPPGTIVTERIVLTEIRNDEDELTMATTTTATSAKLVELGRVTKENPELVVAKGGTGGEGTAALLGNKASRRPRVGATGGERKVLDLTLQIVADVALVAVPNAGKSTLLAAVTRAKPKIANYPFTTVIPNLGVWIPPESSSQNAYRNGGDENEEGSSYGGGGSDGLVLCDVPGLIAGASEGVGLGHAFLRHVERCHVILHLVDSTSDDPIADYQMINREIVRYGTGQLAKMPQVVVVNKIDALTEEGDENSGSNRPRLTKAQLHERLREEMPHTRLMWVSAKERDGVDDLMLRLASFVKKVKTAASR